MDVPAVTTLKVFWNSAAFMNSVASRAEVNYELLERKQRAWSEAVKSANKSLDITVIDCQY